VGPDHGMVGDAPAADEGRPVPRTSSLIFLPGAARLVRGPHLRRPERAQAPRGKAATPGLKRVEPRGLEARRGPSCGRRVVRFPTGTWGSLPGRRRCACSGPGKGQAGPSRPWAHDPRSVAGEGARGRSASVTVAPSVPRPAGPGRPGSARRVETRRGVRPPRTGSRNRGGVPPPSAPSTKRSGRGPVSSNRAGARAPPETGTGSPGPGRGRPAPRVANARPWGASRQVELAARGPPGPGTAIRRHRPPKARDFPTDRATPGGLEHAVACANPPRTDGRRATRHAVPPRGGRLPASPAAGNLRNWANVGAGRDRRKRLASRAKRSSAPRPQRDAEAPSSGPTPPWDHDPPPSLAPAPVSPPY